MSPRNMHVSPDLSFPRDAVDKTLVVYGNRGMGKTNFLAVFGEELDKAGHRFSVLDPVGKSWGLQHASSGDRGGIELVILGGQHGDIDITPGSGAIVADFVSDESVSTVVDISSDQNGRMWLPAEKIRFTADYILQLYQRQGSKKRIVPLMQIIDECGRLCPETAPKGAADIARCVDAIEQLVELGRNVAVGVTLVTQRSARLKKSVSELAECMIAFRTVGPRSVGAIMDWLGDNIERERHKEIVTNLRSLPIGSALVVSPGWLEHEGVVRFRARETFDSSKTPTAGSRTPRPGRARKPDLGKYRQRMAETIKSAQETDPKLLKREHTRLEHDLAQAKKRITELQAQLENGRGAGKPPKSVEKPVLRDKQVAALERIVDKLRSTVAAQNELADKVQAVNEALGEPLVQIVQAVKLARAPAPAAMPPSSRPAPPKPSPSPEKSAKREVSQANGHPTLGAGNRKVMIAVAEAGEDGITRKRLTIRCGYARSTRDRLLSELHAAGYTDNRGDKVFALQAGIDWLGDDYEPLPSDPESRREFWRKRLTDGQLKVFDVIVDAYPNAVERTDISEHTGHARSTRDRLLAELAAPGLIVKEGTAVKASAELFD